LLYFFEHFALDSDRRELTGITHYETSRFRDALRQAIPWLREVWK